MTATPMQSHTRIEHPRLYRSDRHGTRLQRAQLRERLGRCFFKLGQAAGRRACDQRRRATRAKTTARPHGQAVFLPPERHSPQRPDWLAGLRGLELRNVIAKYLLRKVARICGDSANLASRDYSCASCEKLGAHRRASRFLHMAAGAAALHAVFSHRECTGLSDQTDPLDHWLSGRRRRRHGCPYHGAVAVEAARSTRHHRKPVGRFDQHCGPGRGQLAA